MNELKNIQFDAMDGWKEISIGFKNDIRRYFGDHPASPTMDQINGFYKLLLQTKLDQITQKYLFEEEKNLGGIFHFESYHRRFITTGSDRENVLNVIKNINAQEGADIKSDFAHLGSKFRFLTMFLL